MRHLLLTTLLALSLTSCTDSNDLGECIGIAEDGRSDLNYKISIRNAFWSVVGFETIIAPILWATDFAKCPTSYKQANIKSSINQGK